MSKKILIGWGIWNMKEQKLKRNGSCGHETQKIYTTRGRALSYCSDYQIPIPLYTNQEEIQMAEQR
jgi:hypothetical protein